MVAVSPPLPPLPPAPDVPPAPKPNPNPVFPGPPVVEAPSPEPPDPPLSLPMDAPVVPLGPALVVTLAFCAAPVVAVVALPAPIPLVAVCVLVSEPLEVSSLSEESLELQFTSKRATRSLEPTRERSSMTS